MSNIAEEIETRMVGMSNDAQAVHLMRFFKCGEGDYGEGDQFLGIRVPQTRTIVKEFRKEVRLSDIRYLVNSRWHEVRLAGFLLMTELYKQAKKRSSESAKEVVDCYLSSLHRANNWDLVDLSAAYILGDRLVTHPDERRILYQLARMDGKLWHQRVAMVATWMLIRHGEFDDTFKIAEMYLSHSHDLIHKATGWMLRETGKRGGEKELREFLDNFASKMPRTMLRYAIEKFPEQERQHYLRMKPLIGACET